AVLRPPERRRGRHAGEAAHARGALRRRLAPPSLALDRGHALDPQRVGGAVLLQRHLRDLRDRAVLSRAPAAVVRGVWDGAERAAPAASGSARQYPDRAAAPPAPASARYFFCCRGRSS